MVEAFVAGLAVGANAIGATVEGATTGARVPVVGAWTMAKAAPVGAAEGWEH